MKTRYGLFNYYSNEKNVTSFKQEQLGQSKVLEICHVTGAV